MLPKLVPSWISVWVLVVEVVTLGLLVMLIIRRGLLLLGLLGGRCTTKQKEPLGSTLIDHKIFCI